MQTSIIPDESLIQTFAASAPAHKDRVRSLAMYWLKAFSGNNPYNLCRHLSQADFCGQGPGLIEPEDLIEIVSNANKFFFARKFATNDTKAGTIIIN